MSIWVCTTLNTKLNFVIVNTLFIYDKEEDDKEEDDKEETIKKMTIKKMTIKKIMKKT